MNPFADTLGFLLRREWPIYVFWVLLVGNIGIASPVLANLALDGLERKLRRHFPRPKRGYHAKAHLVRYCDDWIITACSREVLEQEVKPRVEHFLEARGLSLSPAKTRIIHIA